MKLYFLWFSGGHNYNENQFCDLIGVYASKAESNDAERRYRDANYEVVRDHIMRDDAEFNHIEGKLGDYN